MIIAVKQLWSATSLRCQQFGQTVSLFGTKEKMSLGNKSVRCGRVNTEICGRDGKRNYGLKFNTLRSHIPWSHFKVVFSKLRPP